MFGTKILIDKLNTAINSGTLEELEIVQALGAIESLEKHAVSSVQTSADLPNPITNKGRFFWIENELRYTFSNGISWDINSIIVAPYINLWFWGSNTSGQLGDGTTVSKLSPVSVIGGFTDWVQVSAGVNSTIALRSNGTAWSWGSNAFGQLGDGTIISKLSPVSVVGGFTDWTQTSVAGQHVLGLRADGTAWAWGINLYGQIGDNTTTSRLSPVSVVGGGVSWAQLSAGNTHSLGLRANGTAWAWGRNTSGRLGDNTATNRSSPVSVVGGFVDWIQLSAGTNHSIGLRTNGTAWTWGENSSGQLGDNTTVSKSSPVSVIGGFTDWVQVSAGGTHSLAIRANGTAWGWGAGAAGRIGNGAATAINTSPVSVVGGFTDWLQLSGGTTHSLGLRANGTAWAWGEGGTGKLGDNTVINKSSPVSVVGGFTDWVQLNTSNNSSHSAGIRG